MYAKLGQQKNFWKNLREHVTFCFSMATTHGLIHVVRRGRHTLERVLWMGLVIGAFAVATDQALEAWRRYKKSPVVVTLEKDFFNWNIDYPSIYICLRKRSPEAHNFLLRFNEEYNLTATKQDWEEYADDLLLTTYYNYHTLKKYANGSRKDYIPSDMYLEVVDAVADKIVDSSKKEKKNPGSSTVWPQDVNGSYDLVLTEFGLCHSFNFKFAAYFDIKNFTEMVNFESNYPNITKTINDKLVLIQRQIFADYYLFAISSNEIIDITSRYFFGKHGFKTKIYMDVLDIASDEDTRDVSPEGRNCRFSDEHQDFEYNPFYSYNLCRMECRIKLALKYCNCTPYYYKRKDGEPVCNMTGMYCLSKHPELIYLTDPESEKSLCTCLQNCNSQGTTLRNPKSKTWFMGTQLTVVFDSFPLERYRRSLILTKTDVLLQVGSLFALFLGCSVLSLIEIPYFFSLRFFWSVFGNRRIEPDL